MQCCDGNIYFHVNLKCYDITYSYRSYFISSDNHKEYALKINLMETGRSLEFSYFDYSTFA